MNQLWNCKNTNQGDEKRVLTICSAGILRAPTAAFVIQEAYGFNTRAAGIVSEYSLIPVTEVLVHWADEFVFMDIDHLEYFERLFSHDAVAKAKISDGHWQVLYVPDDYPRMDKRLVSMIKEKYVPDQVQK